MPECSRNSTKDNIFKNHTPDKMYDELTYESLNDIYQKLKTSSNENKKSLLIMDDCGASLKNNDIAKLLREIIYNRRHLHVVIIIMVQSFISLPLEIRKMCSNLILWKPSKVEFENIAHEILQLDRQQALELMNYSYVEKHDYLFITDTNKIYKNFDEIIINSNT